MKISTAIKVSEFILTTTKIPVIANKAYKKLNWLRGRSADEGRCITLMAVLAAMVMEFPQHLMALRSAV